VPTLLEARDLACRRGGRLVFEAVSFALPPGEALLLHGPNGSGKSSLLRILAGLLPASNGQLSWRGEPVSSDPAAQRNRLHYIGHAHGLKTALTARENLEVAVALGAGSSDAIAPALGAAGLERLADLPVRLLSAGQRRRVALARLHTTARPLWLLDEPGVGLDRTSRERLEVGLEAHRRDGGVVVVASHGDVLVRDPLVLDLGL
jgi:heme exporter protein A